MGLFAHSRYVVLLLVFALLPGGCQPAGQTDTGNSSAKFEISLASSLGNEPVDGRVLLMLSSGPEFDPQSIADGSPIFGVTVDGLKVGDVAVIDASVPGQPVASIADFPAGEYYVKAYLNVYTTFNRADGHVVKLHMDQGEGQQWNRSPGNFFSTPKKILFDPESGDTISVILDQVIPPIPAPDDTEWVRNITIRSDLVSEFWGQPMHIGAKVLLPKGYHDDPDARYPLVIEHGHFSSRNPGRFTPPRDGNDGNALYQAWNSDDFPRFLLVTIQHATPYYDDSYAINSANMGPYGDAINYELLPEIEKQFRAIGEPYARAVTGCSTGGWEAIATQVWYPDLYGSAWVFAPDQVDFHYYGLVDLYAPGENAYYQENEWSKVPLLSNRQTDGRPGYTIRQENLREEIIGPRYRSGGQWAVWNALFAPVAEDGYPEPIWDPWTGEINPEMAEWAIDHYDIVSYLRKNWPTIGPKLDGKLDFTVGRMDNWYLEEAVYLMDDFLAGSENPHVSVNFEYGARGRHCWSPWRDNNDPGGLYRKIIAQMEKNRP